MKSLYEKICSGEESLSLVGLGYVGMPIAAAFANEGAKGIGFDLNTAKIDLYKSGVDPTHEVGDEAIRNTTVEFAADEAQLRRAKFHMEAVRDADCIILAVAHQEFKEIGLDALNAMYKEMPQNEKALMDVKGLYSIQSVREKGFTYWRL